MGPSIQLTRSPPSHIMYRIRPANFGEGLPRLQDWSSPLGPIDGRAQSDLNVHNMSNPAPSTEHDETSSMISLSALTCFICFEQATVPMMTKCCTRICCTNCIQTWLRKNKTCPICRKKIDRKDLLDMAGFCSSLLVNIEENSTKAHPAIELCPIHTSNRLDYYCKECNKPVCSDCVILDSDHKSHAIISVSDVRASCIASLQETLTSLQRRKGDLEKIILENTRTKDKLRDEREKIGKDIEKWQQQKKEELDQQTENLIAEWNQSQNEAETITVRIADAQRQIEQVIKSKSDQLIVASQKSLSDGVETLLSSIPQTTSILSSQKPALSSFYVPSQADPSLLSLVFSNKHPNVPGPSFPCSNTLLASPLAPQFTSFPLLLPSFFCSPSPTFCPPFTVTPYPFVFQIRFYHPTLDLPFPSSVSTFPASSNSYLPSVGNIGLYIEMIQGWPSEVFEKELKVHNIRYEIKRAEPKDVKKEKEKEESSQQDETSDESERDEEEESARRAQRKRDKERKTELAASLPTQCTSDAFRFIIKEEDHAALQKAIPMSVFLRLLERTSTDPTCFVPLYKFEWSVELFQQPNAGNEAIPGFSLPVSHKKGFVSVFEVGEPIGYSSFISLKEVKEREEEEKEREKREREYTQLLDEERKKRAEGRWGFAEQADKDRRERVNRERAATNKNENRGRIVWTDDGVRGKLNVRKPSWKEESEELQRMLCLTMWAAGIEKERKEKKEEREKQAEMKMRAEREKQREEDEKKEQERQKKEMEKKRQEEEQRRHQEELRRKEDERRREERKRKEEEAMKRKEEERKKEEERQRKEDEKRKERLALQIYPTHTIHAQSITSPPHPSHDSSDDDSDLEQDDWWDDAMEEEKEQEEKPDFDALLRLIRPKQSSPWEEPNDELEDDDEDSQEKIQAIAESLVFLGINPNHLTGMIQGMTRRRNEGEG
ncbi:hypothetical protein BLNAU_8618 [Blattamonas nauphoetae]|uniref:RING-type domain-containing protein n=1 Tax=Blattamonas nauphoetae TaxID=2049346 RepID=A0ABQ9XY53_9EUKA|nr:hypothetical protein BLNAU_8618 [Blattamonas nauphoetae]